MTTEKDKKNNSWNKTEESREMLDNKAKALLSIRATDPPPSEKCPSDEKLAALVDGRLSRKERKAVLGHLDACSICYRQWLDISSIKEQESERAAPVFKVVAKRLYWSSGFAVAVAACLVLVLWRVYMRSPEMAGMLAQSYKTALEGEMILKHIDPARIPQLPWEKERIRSKDSQPLSSASRAFSAGFKGGRKELVEVNEKRFIDTEKWDTTQWAPFFFLGRWCILLQSVCQSGYVISPSFWEHQSQFLNSMEEELNKHTDVEEFEIDLVKKTLKQIKHILKESHSDGNTCQLLEPEIEAIKASLS